MGVDELEGALLALLAGPPADDARVEGLRRLSGGASRETWAFDLTGGGRRRELILQRLRPGAVSATSGISIVQEAAVLEAAGRHGVPVAGVVASDDGAVLGSAGMVVERLAGETIPRRLLRDDEWQAARSRLCAQVGQAAAAIHRIPLDAAPGLPATDQVGQCRDLLDGLGEPHPAFELALRWLEEHRPPTGELSVVHGDLRMGNLLVDRDGLRAVLDWELAHHGDPIEDLGWFCVRAWRFGSPLAAGGVASRHELIHAYEGASHRRVDRDALRWWEVLGTVKWGAICVLQAWGHLSGASRSVELATIGRRVCENEWDVLGLLPGEALPGGVAPDAPRSAPLHDRPTGVELVEAVREWIDGDVRAATDGRVAFHARVAVNALRMVERELALEPALSDAHRARLDRLGCTDDRELVTRIRRGDLDERTAEVRALVGASVRDKLLVANPSWLEPDT